MESSVLFYRATKLKSVIILEVLQLKTLNISAQENGWEVVASQLLHNSRYIIETGLKYNFFNGNKKRHENIRQLSIILYKWLSAPDKPFLECFKSICSNTRVMWKKALIVCNNAFRMQERTIRNCCKHRDFHTNFF